MKELKNSFTAVASVLTLLGILLVQVVSAAEQQPGTPPSRKEQLEVQKLELELASLREKKHEWPAWLTAALGFMGGIAGTAASVWAVRGSRLAALDQAVHEKRLELYVDLVKATERLALYFPLAQAVAQQDCIAMGGALRAWYFAGGGLVMSTAARDAYFRLARALTRASLAAELNVPIFSRDALDISAPALEQYRRELAALRLDDVDGWNFGGSGAASQPPALRFKDFVFLQSLSSSLRTELCADLRSRRRPS